MKRSTDRYRFTFTMDEQGFINRRPLKTSGRPCKIKGLGRQNRGF